MCRSIVSIFAISVHFICDINKYENKNVKIAISQWDNKILIRSIGKNSYYLKFAIIKILTYFLGDNLPNVWNS